MFQTFRLTPGIAYKLPKTIPDLVVQWALHNSQSILAYVTSCLSLHKQPSILHIPALFLDSGVQRVLHKSHSVLNNTRHSLYIPKDSQPRQVQAYYQKQDLGGAWSAREGIEGKWRHLRTEISPSFPSWCRPCPSLTTNEPLVWHHKGRKAASMGDDCLSVWR